MPARTRRARAFFGASDDTARRGIVNRIMSPGSPTLSQRQQPRGTRRRYAVSGAAQFAVVVTRHADQPTGDEQPIRIGDCYSSPIPLDDDEKSVAQSRASLSTPAYSSDSSERAASFICAICMEHDANDLVGAPCGHPYHRKCFAQYVHKQCEPPLQGSHTISVPCPLCRYPCTGVTESLAMWEERPCRFVIDPWDIGPRLQMDGIYLYL